MRKITNHKGWLSAILSIIPFFIFMGFFQAIGLGVSSALGQAGKYGFFTIPNKDNWTVILNKNWKQHGKDEYDEKDDVLRFEVKPKFSEEITEQLIYRVKKVNGSQGTISLSWEKITISFPFSISRYEEAF